MTELLIDSALLLLMVGVVIGIIRIFFVVISFRQWIPRSCRWPHFSVFIHWHFSVRTIGTRIQTLLSLTMVPGIVCELNL